MTTDQLTDLNELLITATRCVEMQHDSPALSALAKARRLLGELSGNSGELPKPSPVSVKLPCDCAECCGCKTLEEANAWLLKNPGKADSHAKASTERLIGSETVGDPIDRTLPPGFEVRKFEKGWYPLDLRSPKDYPYYYEQIGRWAVVLPCSIDPAHKNALAGNAGYDTEREAYADAPRWLAAAGVDWPQVTGPHEDGKWDIRTNTHWWSQFSEEWTLRNRLYDLRGAKESKADAEHELPAARRAWVEMMKKEDGR